MKIENHLLTDPPDGIELQHVGGRIGSFITPEVILLHFGVTHSLEATIAAQRAQGYWAHLTIDGFHDGERSVSRVAQHLPFNQRGSHAGESSWRGLSGVNGFSIGIEIANPGPLVRGADGRLRTTYGKLWPEDDAVEARHKSGLAPRDWTHWAQYADEEIDLLVHLCTLLVRTYPTIEDVVGHDDVSPGRKFDPGPALPIEHIRARAFAYGR